MTTDLWYVIYMVDKRYHKQSALRKLRRVRKQEYILDTELEGVLWETLKKCWNVKTTASILGISVSECELRISAMWDDLMEKSLIELKGGGCMG